MQRAALARVTLAEALAAGDQRSPAEVLLDAVATADVLLRQAKTAAIDAGEPTPVAVFDELVGSLGRAATLARIARDAGLTADVVTGEQQGGLLYVLTAASSAVGLNVSAAKVRAAVGAAMREFGQAGPEVEARGRFSADAVKRIREAADKAAGREVAELREAVLGELRREARSGRCPVCGGGRLGIEAPAAETPVEPLVPGRSAPSREDAVEPHGPVRRAGGAVDADVVESRPAVKATAEVVKAVSGYGVCPGCGRRTDPAHDATCGYPAAAARHGGAW